MSFVSAPAAMSFHGRALLCALIGCDRLGDSDRGCQSNCRESSDCHCLKPSFVHCCSLTPKCSSLIQGSFLSSKTPFASGRLRYRAVFLTQRRKGAKKKLTD